MGIHFGDDKVHQLTRDKSKFQVYEKAYIIRQLFPITISGVASLHVMLWWPGVDADIEQKVKQCNQYQINQRKLPVMPLHPREWPGKPWSRIHVDYAGPFQGKMFLAIVDSYSKWLDVYVTSSASSAITIHKVQTTFVALPWPTVNDPSLAYQN